MKVSQNGIELIARFESFSSKPYLCPARVPTIGFGATYYENGIRVTMKDKEITKEYAYKLLEFQSNKYAEAINRYIKVKLTQNQFDALVSFVFNIGIGAFQKSTLLRYINEQRSINSIISQFKRWNRGGGGILEGLVKRREIEAELYNRS